MQQYEFISTRNTASGMFVNVKLNGQELRPSPSCHRNSDEYSKINGDNLQPGDIISLDCSQNGNFLNIKKGGYGGIVSRAGGAGGNPSQQRNSGGSGKQGSWRHPDEITMTESLTLAKDMVIAAISNEMSKAVKKTETMENLKNMVIGLAQDFYMAVKDPMKNALLESDASDVGGQSPDTGEGGLPDPVDPGTKE